MPVSNSGTPLAQKLGLKPGMRIVVLNPPWDYRATVRPPEGTAISTRMGTAVRFGHLFVRSQRELARTLPRLAKALADEGMLWVSWPKKTSGVATDLDENLIRQLGLAERLVDVKVCAVDEVWSGLKFVRRVRDRAISR